MIKFECDKCGTILHEATYETMLEYDVELSYILDENGNFSLDSLPAYIIFKCPFCYYSVKVNINDILKPFLEVVLSRLSRFRIQKCLSSIKENNKLNPDAEDNGISFCGMCQGFLDGDGYCYNDVIDKCIVRRDILGR